jgi:pimeloyl-ACP methyl ester carboxylesterase
LASPRLPLTVIAHGKPFPDAAIEDGWDAAQERLAALSSRGRLVVATGDGHNIAGENPALVADEVRRMLETLSR